jgi:hypothetical protein
LEAHWKNLRSNFMFYGCRKLWFNDIWLSLLWCNCFIR